MPTIIRSALSSAVSQANAVCEAARAEQIFVQVEKETMYLFSWHRGIRGL